MAQQIQAETSNLLLSHTRAGVGGGDSENNRTGRWSGEEVSFVDHLVSCFDKGVLPLPHGVKLNEFLGDMLLCKSSRLTKKMKNAKLSSRSFSVRSPVSGVQPNCATFSHLEEQFLASIPSEAMQLELSFNMTKLWRMHFSNLCIQIGYELLDATDWVSSLEEMERRAAEAEEVIRRVRRRRMGLALRQDVGQGAALGVFIAGKPASNTTIQPSTVASASGIGGGPRPGDSNLTKSGSTHSFQKTASMISENDSSKPEEDEVDFLTNVLELSTALDGNGGHSTVEDYLIGIDDLVDPLSQLNDAPRTLGDCGPFLGKVINYMEMEGLPFEHADIWVPSILGNDRNDTGDVQGSNSLRLFHAGHATRSDLDASLALRMNEYGIYSTNFSFAPEVGLPGRVYANGKTSWETGLDAADPKYFERAGGANVYGIKCAVGIPLDASSVGRIVLAMYGTKEVPEDKNLTAKLLAEFTKWVPEPKWKLIIDLGPSDATQNGRQPAETASATLPVQQYNHSKTDPQDKVRRCCALTAFHPILLLMSLRHPFFLRDRGKGLQLIVKWAVRRLRCKFRVTKKIVLLDSWEITCLLRRAPMGQGTGCWFPILCHFVSFFFARLKRGPMMRMRRSKL